MPQCFPATKKDADLGHLGKRPHGEDGRFAVLGGNLGIWGQTPYSPMAGDNSRGLGLVSPLTQLLPWKVRLC